MDSFFPTIGMKEKAYTSTVPKCGACRLYRGCKSPKMEVWGKGERRVMITGEAPGSTEDEKGIPFCGDAGDELRKCLPHNIDLERDCWVLNALACRPPRNATPTDSQIEYCRPTVMNAIRDLQPDVVILLGGSAIKSLIGHVWKEKVSSVTRWVGWQIPNRVPNVYICPTYHPSYVMREDSEVLRLIFRRHLRAAFKLEGTPWDEWSEEDGQADIEIIEDPNRAEWMINRIREMGNAVVFDYETNCLKPDRKEAEIICCSLYTLGTYSIAFPWVEPTISAMKKLLQSDQPKWGQNIKFEERWTRAKLGISVRNWQWDTMVNAHLLDCRPEITGIKFQAYVHLGAPAWDEEIRSYLEGKGKSKNSLNRIKEVDMKKLLVYCGLDSLYEYRVAEIQRRILGVK